MGTPSRNGSQQSRPPGSGAGAARHQGESPTEPTSGDGGSQMQQRQTGQSQRSDQQPSGQQQSQSELSTRRSSGNAVSRRSQDPLTSVLQLSREMDRLFDTLLDRSFGSLFGQGLSRAPELDELNALWSPRIDVRERGDALRVHVDLPGVRNEDVRIEATSDGLAISGERSEERDESNERSGYRMSERRYGSFYRLIQLPETALAEDAKATMRNGVLEVTIPLERGKGRKQIRIES
jgi:HSP20 family molecular chaperone IbpA